ncbi:hypothetical protein E1286_19000 [Nonomuraea terrae]|uniref:Uncharacterized protein n=1 Tax=Nonomuraea terrae TaxID=2530383 RepID=A0A4R4YPG7_9ACTN|nr:hypothetical protein [Nonomuraea terrae]TDD47045.1 hypothetical protein E1286_19000 [Nonomuraea terrae]
MIVIPGTPLPQEQVLMGSNTHRRPLLLVTAGLQHLEERRAVHQRVVPQPAQQRHPAVRQHQASLLGRRDDLTGKLDSRPLTRIGP